MGPAKLDFPAINIHLSAQTDPDPSVMAGSKGAMAPGGVSGSEKLEKLDPRNLQQDPLNGT